jgi:glycine/D-amino acid oxidase-like deaminating enzyme
MSNTDVLIIGAGSIGIAAAYAIKSAVPKIDVCLVECGQPMALTSTQSGENYRNWWPHNVMRHFMDDSIDLMERISQDTNNRINLTRRGYMLATRAEKLSTLHADLATCYGDDNIHPIRMHEPGSFPGYVPPTLAHWKEAPNGVDVIADRAIIDRHYPYYDPSVMALIHIRRGGTVDSHQMGQYMLECYRELGGKRLAGKVINIDRKKDFIVAVGSADGGKTIRARKIVNAAGPFVKNIAAMIGVDLPVQNFLHQKIAFEDTAGVIDRRMPFSIDLDRQEIEWTDEERELIGNDQDLSRYTDEMPGAVHCRPEGTDGGAWVKLGWAFNEDATEATYEPPLDDSFPEIVLRGAARLNPGLKVYYGRLPQRINHYGGFYTMTQENWPLVGPMGVNGAYVAGALSGFGTMAACMTGELIARWLHGVELPDYAESLSLARYQDGDLMLELNSAETRGIL